MNVVDAFLTLSAVAYFLAVLMPKPTIKNSNIIKEKVLMFLLGLFLALNLVFNFRSWWFAMGMLWTLFAGKTYLGYVEWNVLWKDEVSDEAQMFMFMWDLLIALCCFIKF